MAHTPLVNPVVGLVGWRGMVGSVLMQRMQDEDDLAYIEPVFFSTSNAGGEVPLINGKKVSKQETRLQDANDLKALARCDVILSCQGGDYTKAIYPAPGQPADRPDAVRGTNLAASGPGRCRAQKKPVANAPA